MPFVVIICTCCVEENEIFFIVIFFISFETSSMTTQNGNYADIQEGQPRITSYNDNGVRTTTTTTRLGQDPSEKPRETVSVRTVQHPDSTETITVTERKLPPIRFTETITREKAPKKVQIAKNTTAVGPATEVLQSINIPPTATEVAPYPKTVSRAREKNRARRKSILIDFSIMLFVGNVLSMNQIRLFILLHVPIDLLSRKQNRWLRPLLFVNQHRLRIYKYPMLVRHVLFKFVKHLHQW